MEKTELRPARRIFSRKLVWPLALVVLLLIFLTRTWWLAAAGSFLVSADHPQRADIGLVLAGDATGNRIIKAGELIRDGFIPRAVVSGPDGLYGFYECDLAIRFAVRAGFPESYFVPAPNRSRSTVEEAKALIPAVRNANAKRVLLITSDYHTRRAGRIFRNAAPDLQFIVVAAPDVDFNAKSWWTKRQGRKTFLYEWLKTVAEWLGQ